MKRFFVVIILFLAGCGQLTSSSSHSVALKELDAEGTPPRLEREFKYSVQSGDFDLKKAVRDSDLWQAPGIVGSSYYLDEEVEEFVYLDIYFDTEDKLNYKNAVSYRLRQRFKDMESEPYRMEFQAKVDRQELGDGFSTVYESRFEFRDESEPFSSLNPAPRAPWDLDEFISYFQAGKYKQYYTWPAKSVVDYLIPEYTDETHLVFEPELRILTKRQRQHLNMVTPWGSGPNPDQAFIISFDTSYVYDGDDLVGEFMEVEVEFERNVSEKLDNDILAGEDLGVIRDAFLEDQKTIMSVIAERIEVVPASKSKYLQAYELIND